MRNGPQDMHALYSGEFLALSLPNVMFGKHCTDSPGIGLELTRGAFITRMPKKIAPAHI